MKSLSSHVRDLAGLSSTRLASMTDSSALDKWHDLEQGLVLFFYVSTLIVSNFQKRFSVDTLMSSLRLAPVLLAWGHGLREVTLRILF